jgi:hypothetical protein
MVCDQPNAFEVRPGPVAKTAKPGHSVARARLVSGLLVDEVFTSTTEAPRGGGRARRGDWRLVVVASQWRGVGAEVVA